MEIGQGTTNGGVKPWSAAEPGSRRNTLKNAQAETEGGRVGEVGWGRSDGGGAADAEGAGIVSRTKPAGAPTEKGLKVSRWI